MRPTSNHQLTLSQFTILLDNLEEETRQKLFFSFTRILTPEKLAQHNAEAKEKFRKRNNPSEEDAPVMVEMVSSQGNQIKENIQNQQIQERRGTFDDIVPIENNEDNEENFLEFEPVDVVNDDQAGQGLRLPQCDEEVKDHEFSEIMQNDKELDLTSSKVYFTDKQAKSSRRYNQQEDEQAKEDFDNIEEVNHADEIDQDSMPPMNHNNSKAQVNETAQSDFRKLP